MACAGCHALAMEIPTTIVCIDCGGTAHLLTHQRVDEPWAAGDVVAYRCADCLDRWDMELTEDDLSD